MLKADIATLARIALHDSPYACAARAAGFVFGKVEVCADPFDTGFILSMDFSCVCGRREHVRQCISGIQGRQLRGFPTALFDLAAYLHKNGSFSRKHLAADGYSPEEVERIASTYEAELERTNGRL